MLPSKSFDQFSALGGKLFVGLEFELNLIRRTIFLGSVPERNLELWSK